MIDLLIKTFISLRFYLVTWNTNKIHSFKTNAARPYNLWSILVIPRIDYQDGSYGPVFQDGSYGPLGTHIDELLLSFI